MLFAAGARTNFETTFGPRTIDRGQFSRLLLSLLRREDTSIKLVEGLRITLS